MPKNTDRNYTTADYNAAMAVLEGETTEACADLMAGDLAEIRVLKARVAALDRQLESIISG